jgi:transcriptional regulator with XRE-family HTH domain
VTTAQRTAAPTAGDLLRHWRQEARRSQLDLASASGVSARHLSFVETGRAQPSRALLLHLAEHLDMPLRERNALFLAAGYAPAYAESDLGAEHLCSARDATAPLLDGVDPALLAAPNAYRIGLHPDGLLRRVRNPAPWIAHLGQRLTRAVRWSGDPRLAELLTEIRSYPGVAEVLDARPDPGAHDLLMTVTLASRTGDLSLHTAVTTFGGPHDVTLSELAVESFFPADASTRERLHEAARA